MNPLSIQLYTVRNLFAEDLPGTLESLAEVGFAQVEPFGFTSSAEELAENLPRLGLTAPTAHISLLGADLPAVFRAAQRIGISTVFDPMIDPARWSTRESVEKIAAELKTVAEQAADYGLRVGYHNHAFELESRIDGVTALEVFAEAAGDALDLEVDTYWAEVGGVEAIGLLEALGERVKALHIKDGPRTKENKDQVALGSGGMAIPEILAAAPQALAVVELDDFDGDIREAVRDSYRYLTQNGLAGGAA